MSLKEQLNALQRAVAAARPGEMDTFRGAIKSQHESAILDRALKAGERMPGFTLPDTQGRPLSLSGLLLRGPVVVSFYRGDWCDCCAMELNALSAVYDDVTALGASVVGISPQPPGARLACEGPEPPFPLLYDAAAKFARRCRIAFAIPDALRPIYITAGYDPLADGKERWLLPLPATYVVDRTGDVVFSYVDADWTIRPEPADLITILAHLKRVNDQA